MLKRITKREIVFFVLGLLTFFVVETLWNIDGSIKAFKEGYNEAHQEAESKTIN